MSRRLRMVRWFLLALSAVMLLYGLYQGGFQSVFSKTVMLCYECMGIG